MYTLSLSSSLSLRRLHVWHISLQIYPCCLQHMLSMPCVRYNKLSCLQVLLRCGLVSSAAVLLAACLLPCLVGISALVADGDTMVGTVPSCALMVTVSAACIATQTNLGRRWWSALWVTSHSLLPWFAYLPVMSRGCALLSMLQRKEKGTLHFLVLIREKPEEEVLSFLVSIAVFLYAWVCAGTSSCLYDVCLAQLQVNVL